MGLMDKIKSLLAPPKEKGSEPTEQPEGDPAAGSAEPASPMGETTDEEQPRDEAGGEPAEATATTDEQSDASAGEKPVPPTSDEPDSGKDSAP